MRLVSVLIFASAPAVGVSGVVPLVGIPSTVRIAVFSLVVQSPVPLTDDVTMVLAADWIKRTWTPAL
jgi:hypothetical protein